MERPERIHASILGLATAYVRLGGRHAEGHSPLHPKRKMKSPSPFKIHKTRRTLPLTSQAAINIHGLKWMEELQSMCDTAETKLALNGKELARPVSTEQSGGNNKTEKAKLHEGDLYLCSESLAALEGALGGVCEGIDAVFDDSPTKRAFVCIRPPGHHCSADYPSGFCWLNNVHVGIGHAAITHGLTHAAIIDFDLHHGDGSQSITWAHNRRMASMPRNTPMSKKTSIGYFSLHDINSYPCEMGDDEKVQNASLCLENAHGQTIWNVHLQPWKTEAEFWKLYEDRYLTLLSKARTFLQLHTDRLRQSPMHPQPKAAIFLSAGFDASEWESPGMQRHQVNVPTDFYARFTRDVVRMAEEAGLGVGGRVISVLEGGYSDRALMSGVLSHLSGLTSMDRLSETGPTSSGLGQDMARRLGSLNINGHLDAGKEADEQPTETFDPSWWAIGRLEEIESLVNPPAPAAPPKKQRNALPPTYSSTTQSFSAKVVTPPAGRRSLSGTASYFQSGSFGSPKVPEQPPPPPVGWATAAHELSKLLIPSDRETRSCKPEELNAEASRARKARQSAIGLPAELPIAAPAKEAVSDKQGMQLRGRTGKAPRYASDEEGDKPVPRANRRRTIADPALLGLGGEPVVPKPEHTSPKKPAAPRGRRVSAASSLTSTSGEGGLEPNPNPSVTSQPRKDSVAVKKPRVPSTTRPDPSGPKPVRKPPPVPRVPGYSVVLNATPSVPENEHTFPSTNGDPKAQDIDHLASSMKKMSIKLNMPPKEVQASREAKKQPVARGRPKSAVPKAPKAAQAKKTTNVDNAISSDIVANKAPSSESIQASANAEAAKLPTTESPPPAIDLQGQLAQPLPPTPPTSDYSQTDSSAQDKAPSELHVQPTSFAAPTAPSIPAPVAPSMAADEPSARGFMSNEPGFPNHEQASSTSPSSGTNPPSILSPQSPQPTTPMRARQDLPIFSATSTIPFGKSNETPPSVEETLGADTLAQIERLARMATPSVQLIGAADMAPVPSAVPRDEPQAQPGAAEAKQENQREASIWDVPDTPDMRRQ